MAVFTPRDIDWFELVMEFDDGPSTMRFENEEAHEILFIANHIKAMERLRGQPATSFQINAAMMQRHQHKKKKSD